jgi:hypothetical protein
MCAGAEGEGGDDEEECGEVFHTKKNRQRLRAACMSLRRDRFKPDLPMGKADSHHHNVYVILLDGAVAKHPSG